jgi:hypothetical protein
MQGKRSPRVRNRTARGMTGDAFAAVVAAFAADRQVTPPGEDKGFGSGALKVKGKIFAMISSKGQFVVRLRTDRVSELIRAGHGVAFAPRPGRPMKEWLVVTTSDQTWVPMAREARRFIDERGNRQPHPRSTA